MITKEAIEQRIAMLTQTKDQHLANANAANGALVEANYWLAQFEQPTAEEAKSEG